MNGASNRKNHGIVLRCALLRAGGKSEKHFSIVIREKIPEYIQEYGDHRVKLFQSLICTHTETFRDAEIICTSLPSS